MSDRLRPYSTAKARDQVRPCCALNIVGDEGLVHMPRRNFKFSAFTRQIAAVLLGMVV